MFAREDDHTRKVGCKPRRLRERFGVAEVNER
jgi:hypothetical protein